MFSENNVHWCLMIAILSLFCFKKALLNDENTYLNVVRFPYSDYYDPFMGLILAFALELNNSPYEGEFGWSFEFNYFLPQNESEYSYPPIIGESDSEERGFFDRATIYEMVETKLDTLSGKFGGKSCFLRVICDMAIYTTKDTDVLGDIVHILLSPSSSTNVNLPKKYSDAENYGIKNRHCKKYNKKCPVDLIGLVTVLGNLLENEFL